MKVAISFAGKKLKKKKTSSKRNVVNPVWNEALVFSLGREMLEHISIEFIVMHDNLLGMDETMGRIVLGPDCTGEEFTHWKDMVNSKSAIARWHHINNVEAPQGGAT